ncbi:MAG: acyltransferase family protein [Clostridia bacterium]|nr:acyltransferase family protein [Clostridia bacterium]
METKRLSYIDWAKAIGICLVCIGHFLPGGNEWKVVFYTFHVPLFIFVGGMLTKCPKGIMDFLKKLGKLSLRILAPYTIWHLISRWAYVKPGLEAGENVWKTWLFIDGKTIWNDALWYAPLIFVTSVVFLLVCWAIRGSKIASFSIGVLSLWQFAWYCANPEPFVWFGHQNFWAGQNIFLYFGVFCIGYACKDIIPAIIQWKENPHKNTLLYMSGGAFLGLLVLSNKLNGTFPISLLYLRFNQGNDGWKFAIMAVLLCVTMVIACGLLPKNRVVEILSKNSLFLMCSHYLFLKAWAWDTGLGGGPETVRLRWGLAVMMLVIYVIFLFMFRLICKRIPHSNKVIGLLGMQF